MKDGVVETFHKNGQLESRTNYRDGKQDSFWERFYENGQVEIRRHFNINGERDGLWE